MVVRGHPKKKRIKLNKKEYEELRSEISADQNYFCYNKHCGAWIGIVGYVHHHKKSKGSGGDDTNFHRGGNCVVLCFNCHHKVHTGELKV